MNTFNFATQPLEINPLLNVSEKVTRTSIPSDIIKRDIVPMKDGFRNNVQKPTKRKK